MTPGQPALPFEGGIWFSILVHTKNPMNQSFGNSRIAAILQRKQDGEERDCARAETLAALRRDGIHAADLIPAVVTLTRVSAGTLDAHDGLRVALKRVVDGIALALGVDDGGRFVEWRYGQRKGPVRHHAVEVHIVRRA